MRAHEYRRSTQSTDRASLDQICLHRPNLRFHKLFRHCRNIPNSYNGYITSMPSMIYKHARYAYFITYANSHFTYCRLDCCHAHG